jgi:hypothetical protein
VRIHHTVFRLDFLLNVHSPYDTFLRRPHLRLASVLLAFKRKPVIRCARNSEIGQRVAQDITVRSARVNDDNWLLVFYYSFFVLLSHGYSMKFLCSLMIGRGLSDDALVGECRSA